MTIDDSDLRDDSVLAAEYVLGLLTEPEVAVFEARLAVDPALRDHYAFWAKDLAALTDDIPAVLPPASVATALQDRLFPEPKQSLLQRLGLIPALIGGLVAALLVLWVTNQGLLQPDPFIGTRYVAEIAAPDQSLVVMATFDPVDGTLRLDRSIGAAKEGRVLELWLIAGNNPPVSLGVLPSETDVVLTVATSLVAAIPDGTLAISDEPPGGSDTGSPTGEVLAVGPVTLL